MSAFYRLRIAFRSWLARHRLVIEFCDECGRTQPLVWTAPNALWASVTDRPTDTDMGGVLCPECFDRRAVAQGRFLRWVPVEERAMNTED